MKRGVLFALFLFLLPVVAAENNKGESLLIIIVSACLVVIVFIAFIMYIIRAKKTYRPLGMQELIAKFKMIQPDNDTYRLTLFIKDAHLYEHSFKEISAALTTLGWEQSLVGLAVNEVLLDEFVIGKLAAGRNKQQIEEALLQAGWPGTAISEAFERCRVF